MINFNNAKFFCKEDISKIENYDKAIADTTQVWHLHHRTEIWWNCSKKELIENDCYYHRKACELIFLTPEEHIRLHNKRKALSDERCRKISESLKGHIVNVVTRKKISEHNAWKGKTSPMKGKIFTEEHRSKLSEALKVYWQSKKIVGI